jgi:hypothetical protein
LKETIEEIRGFMTIPAQDREALQFAKSLLENPGVAAKISNYIGMPIERGLELLPENWNRSIGEVTQVALQKAADAAILSLKDAPGVASSNALHRMGVAFTGGVGGFFGFAGIAVELPISTSLMLRSIADIARSEGESIADPATKLACLEVFALGGNSELDDGTDGGYYAVRTALAKSIADASGFLARKALAEDSAPILMRFIAKVSERFGIHVTEKAAAQAIPAIGAAGGAIINTLFIDHFQDMARGHFIVRKLERKHGKDVIERLYAELPDYG